MEFGFVELCAVHRMQVAVNKNAVRNKVKQANRLRTRLPSRSTDGFRGGVIFDRCLSNGDGEKCTSPENNAETQCGVFGDTLFSAVTTTPIALHGQEIGTGALSKIKFRIWSRAIVPITQKTIGTNVLL